MACAWWESAISLHHHTAGFTFLQVNLLTSYFAFAFKLRRHVELENLAALFYSATAQMSTNRSLGCRRLGWSTLSLVDSISFISCKSRFQNNEEPSGET